MFFRSLLQDKRLFQPFLISLKHYFAAGAGAAGAAGAAGVSAAGAAGAAVSAGLDSSFLLQPTTAKETVAIKNKEIISAKIFFTDFHLLSSTKSTTADEMNQPAVTGTDYNLFFMLVKRIL